MDGVTTTRTGITFEQALTKTHAALKAEGVGVLSDIGMQHAMKEKLRSAWWSASWTRRSW